ncbi:MAG: hypothetical protein EOM69_10195, partial [Clostridia bacterium]|nr:hypothetical protein [Clostridia bacterium]
MPQEAFGTDSTAVSLGEEIFRRGSVTLMWQDAHALALRVGDNPEQAVTLHADGSVECTCGGTGEARCAHIVAATMKAVEDGSLRLLHQERELTLGQDMLLALSRAMPGGESVRLAAVLRVLDNGRISVGLQIGQERLYAVRSIPELLTCYQRGQNMELSARFTYRPAMMRFSKDDEALLAMLMSHIPLRMEEGEAPPVPEEDEDEVAAVRPGSEGRFMLLTGAFLQSVLRFFETRPFLLMADGERQPQASIRTLELPLCFAVSLESGGITVEVTGAENMRPLTPDARYVLHQGRIVRLHGAQARVC